MKIEHEGSVHYTYIDFEKEPLALLNPLALPHECTVPNCPGNRNRLKLEMFDEMLAALEETVALAKDAMHEANCDGGEYDYQEYLGGQITLIAKAKKLEVE